MWELEPFDEFFLYDEAPDKLGNDLGILRFSKITFQELKSFVYEEFCMKVPK